MSKEKDDRLKLKQIVQRNMHETKYFNTTFIHPAAYYENLHMTTKIKERRASIDDNHLNRVLKNAQTIPTTRNQKPEVKEIRKQISNKKEANIKKPKFKEQEAQTKLISISRCEVPTKRLTIPRVKAMCASKQNQRNFHTVPSVRNLNHYEHQKRIKEVMHQRAILEDMLAEHKQLKRDRENIVHEIHIMQNYLDSIRTRLNTSLRKLNEKYAINESHLSDGRCLKNKFYNRANYMGKN